MKITPIKKHGPLSRVFHIVIPDKWDRAMTFVRMQEWYESPEFHHKRFTLEEYMRWYAKTYGKGAFTYPKDWSGFNVPSDAVHAIVNAPDGWTQAETVLFNELGSLGILHSSTGHEPVRGKRDVPFFVDRSRPFYLIATDGKDKEDIAHEIAHGRFFVDAMYRQDVLRTMKHYDTRPLERVLLKKGYSKWTLKDEVHAYALTGWLEGFKPTDELINLRAALRDMVK